MGCTSLLTRKTHRVMSNSLDTVVHPASDTTDFKTLFRELVRIDDLLLTWFYCEHFQTCVSITVDNVLLVFLFNVFILFLFIYRIGILVHVFLKLVYKCLTYYLL